jgi:hypothetical protein
MSVLVSLLGTLVFVALVGLGVVEVIKFINKKSKENDKDVQN